MVIGQMKILKFIEDSPNITDVLDKINWDFKNANNTISLTQISFLPRKVYHADDF